MDLTKLHLNSIHKNGEEEFVVTERFDEKDEIFVKFKKKVAETNQEENL